MTRKTQISLLAILALIAIAPSANAQIASKEYVDDQKDAIITGTNSEWLAESAGMAGLSTTELVETAEGAGVAGAVAVSYFLMNNVQQKLGDADNTGVVVATDTPGAVSYIGIDSEPTEDSDNLVTSGSVYDAIDTLAGDVEDLSINKQDALGGTNNTGVVVATSTPGSVTYTGIDSAPTANSNNLVTSGGVATAIAAATPTVDATPTQNSTNPVQSGGVYDAFGDVYDAIAAATPTVDSAPTENSDNLVTSGGVYDALLFKADNVDLDKAVGMKQNYYNSFVVTDNSGNVKVATGAYVTNDKVASNAAIEMGKIALPTPPAACDTYGCILMRYNNKYVWEMVTRNNGETISDTGGVNVAATATSNNLQGALPSSCQGAGATWNGTTCDVVK